MIRKLETGEFLSSRDKDEAPANNLRPFDAEAERRKDEARKTYLKKH